MSSVSNGNEAPRPATAPVGSFPSRPTTSRPSLPSRPTIYRSSRPTSRPRTAASNNGRPLSSCPRTSLSSSGGLNSSTWIVAIAEGRGVAPEVGLAALDLRSSRCELCQFADSQSYSKLLNKIFIYDPVELLVPLTAIEPHKTKLVLGLEDGAPEAELVPVARKFFNDNHGLTTLTQLSLPDALPALLHGLQRKRFALATLSALFQYIETGSTGVPGGVGGAKQGIRFEKGSVRVEVVGVEGGMMVDATTARNLELVRNAGDTRDKRHCLLGVMDRTSTLMGARLLRVSILQPLAQKETLNARLDCVEEITGGEDAFFTLKRGLEGVGVDVDQLITSLITQPPQTSVSSTLSLLAHTCALARLVRRLPILAAALTGFRSATLRAVRANLTAHGLDEIAQWVEDVVSEEGAAEVLGGAVKINGGKRSRVWAVKANHSALLDIARTTYQENTNDVFTIAADFSDRHGIQFRATWNERGGYQLTASRDAVQNAGDELPPELVNVVWKKKTVIGTTVELKQKNQRINDSLDEVWLMSDSIIRDLLDKVRTKISLLYSVAESLAMLDMLHSFASYCTVVESVRPEFTDTLAIKGGRHPVLDRICAEPFVANDSYASEGTNFQIITGPNMSGKSTYLRQIALIQILSQTGCFVPAEYASVRVADRLLSRLCNDQDDVEGNASTFLVEMREAAYIVENASDSSVIIIDELGRGTSTCDGIGITYAIAEELIKRKSFTFFATHFQSLIPALTTPYHNAVPLHLEVLQTEASRLRETAEKETKTLTKYTYTVRDGSGEEDGYGIRLARMIGMPPEVVETATRVAKKLRAKMEAAALQNEASRAVKRKKACLKFANALVQARRSSTLDEAGMRAYLASLRDNFVEEVKKIEGIADDDEIEVEGNE
ncbi:hypothetical protein M427DRAFT_94796 [Gonapodya prolifera JEL478]|uniref:DNA mismatch repair protein MSH3 n=1 Tax=Gonapodya prolifera (strain JEL478) TaxID=1344416 RepID=A0A139AUR0_GONPJ|nr:hypothetical protein M427DRAFT_94796 [Gonapodya prolifera JEL478]|eukprot:KXS20225.1 hypothetical protein M427DRAFT_94796 [Gonapodya prolifera JEL478]